MTPNFVVSLFLENILIGLFLFFFVFSIFLCPVVINFILFLYFREDAYVGIVILCGCDSITHSVSM